MTNTQVKNLIEIGLEPSPYAELARDIANDLPDFVMFRCGNYVGFDTDGAAEMIEGALTRFFAKEVQS